MRFQSTRSILPFLAFSLVAAFQSSSVFAQSQSYLRNQYVAPVQIPVPGSGKQIEYVGDDFEEPDWKFVHNMPKSSREQNERSYGPLAYSTNRRWSEGPERGQPDSLMIINTPPNGLPGSANALQITTMHSGVPGEQSYDVQQDDLILNVSTRLGSSVLASEMPNCVVRLYLPHPDVWEDRTGPHFGMRLGVRTTAEKPRQGLFAIGTSMQNEPYWPGIWVHFRSKTTRGIDQDSVLLKVRANSLGHDFPVKKIPAEQFGWWTFGMSVSTDGRIHYFARQGVENLRPQDLMVSKNPYGYEAERVTSFFFNICNRNDGRTWSTPFAIDDPQFFVVNSSRIDQIVERKIQYQMRKAEAKNSTKR